MKSAFQVDLDRIKVSATRTDKVPNTSPTAASSGSDLNGMAALDAYEKIRKRLIAFAADHGSVPEDQVQFNDNQVRIGDRRMPCPEFIQASGPQGQHQPGRQFQMDRRVQLADAGR